MLVRLGRMDERPRVDVAGAASCTLMGRIFTAAFGGATISLTNPRELLLILLCVCVFNKRLFFFRSPDDNPSYRMGEYPAATPPGRVARDTDTIAAERATLKRHAERARRLLSLISGRSAFTDEEVRGLETIAQHRQAQLESYDERRYHMDTVITRRLREVESSLSARESILNKEEWEDEELFQVFQREHSALRSELERLKEL